MQKLVTAILTAVVGLIAYPSLPEPTPSQLVEARWVKLQEALRLMTYPNEREIVRRAAAVLGLAQPT